MGLVLRPRAMLIVTTALALLMTLPQGAAASPATPAQNPQYEVPLAYLTPIPIVRVVGSITKVGARIRLVRVRAPRGSRVTLRCGGGRRRGCRIRSKTRTAPASGLVRFREVERRLKAGARLTIFVRKGLTIGKYTAFTIRRKRAPSRVDACLFPGDPFEPRACP